MAKKLWGGRFAKKTNPLVEEFTRSIQYDYKLAEYDVLGSMIHVEILRKAGYLKGDEAYKLFGGLKAIHESIVDGAYLPDGKVEDIHTDIQNKLEKSIGGLALKLHTARSRNDQVVFAVKLYSKVALSELKDGMASLAASLRALAAKNKDVIIPGYTHMQHAQPVYLKDYLWAYVEMLKRDDARLSFIFENIKLTMGAGAMAGTPIEAAKYIIKAPRTLKEMGDVTRYFDIQKTANSLDAVSDRDFVIEILNALSIMAMHLSRLAEDLIIWSTKEFDFVEIDDAFCTGSSLMPQKKNPDCLELIRGYTGTIYGNLVSVLVMMKGLPLTYDRDMQLDKEPLFDSLEIASAGLEVMAGLIKGLEFNKEKIKEQLKDESLYATDLLYYLVKKGVAFKDAHETVGRLVKYSLDRSRDIKEMSENELKKFSGKFVKKEILRLFDPKVSVGSKLSVKRG